MKNIEFKIKKLFRLRNELAKMNNDYKSSTPIKNVNIEINTSKFEQNTNQIKSNYKSRKKYYYWNLKNKYYLFLIIILEYRELHPFF
jgi:hypothetical protein